MASVVVRAARPSDHADIVEANIGLAKETEDIDLDRSIVEAGTRALLENPDRGFYVVAEVDGAFAGSLMVTFEWSDWRNGYYWWIQSVFVRKPFRGRGVFRSLYTHVMDTARRRGDVTQVRLYVESTNTAAQATYQKLGMQQSHYLMYETIIRDAAEPAKTDATAPPS